MTPLPKQMLLIVEDEDALLGALLEKFGLEGFNTLRAKTGEEGLAVALEKKPDVILLDILLPGMSGMDVLEKIRNADEWGKSVPVIMLTNLQANDEIIKRVAKDSPSYYLVKADWN